MNLLDLFTLVEKKFWQNNYRLRERQLVRLLAAVLYIRKCNFNTRRKKDWLKSYHVQFATVRLGSFRSLVAETGK